MSDHVSEPPGPKNDDIAQADADAQTTISFTRYRAVPFAISLFFGLIVALAEIQKSYVDNDDDLSQAIGQVADGLALKLVFGEQLEIAKQIFRREAAPSELTVPDIEFKDIEQEVAELVSLEEEQDELRSQASFYLQIPNSITFILIALTGGALGAFIRFATSVSEVGLNTLRTIESATFFSVQIVVGMIIGVIAYCVLQAKFVLNIIYDTDLSVLQITLHGVATVAFLAGLLSKEIVGTLRSKFETLDPHGH